MEAGKSAMASVKETAGNVAASAKAGMDKTKATVQEKVEKMTAHTPMEKALAEERKLEKVREAEINKQETMQQNAAAQQQTRAAHDGGHVANPGVYPVGGHVTSGAVPPDRPGHGDGEALRRPHPPSLLLVGRAGATPNDHPPVNHGSGCR